MRVATLLAAVLISLVALPTGAFAYVGPGAGLSAIGTFLALIAAFVLAIVGFIWYPIKRLLKGRRKPSTNDTASTGQGTDRS